MAAANDAYAACLWDRCAIRGSIPAAASLTPTSVQLGSRDSRFADKHPPSIGVEWIVRRSVVRAAQNVSLSHERVDEVLQLLIGHGNDIREGVHVNMMPDSADQSGHSRGAF
jgi:hypothetical protein